MPSEVDFPDWVPSDTTNVTDFAMVTIKLNDDPVKELIGVTEGLIDSVPPRRYEVTAIGRKGGKESKGSKVIEVQPNSMTTVEIILPVP